MIQLVKQDYQFLFNSFCDNISLPDGDRIFRDIIIEQGSNTMTVYIYALMGSLIFGVVMTFIVIYICVSLGIDLTLNVWIIGIPAVLAIVVNIVLLEIHFKRKKK
jgi:hypothetical protein